MKDRRVKFIIVKVSYNEAYKTIGIPEPFVAIGNKININNKDWTIIKIGEQVLPSIVSPIEKRIIIRNYEG